MTRRVHTIALAAGATLAVAGLSAGIAAASSGPAVPATSVHTVSFTSHDATAPQPATSAGAASESGTEQATPDAGQPETGQPETQQAETQQPDGPGGHADPAGNVDHQFDGTE